MYSVFQPPRSDRPAVATTYDPDERCRLGAAAPCPHPEHEFCRSARQAAGDERRGPPQPEERSSSRPPATGARTPRSLIRRPIPRPLPSPRPTSPITSIARPTTGGISQSPRPALMCWSPPGDHAYEIVSGTSFAAAHVTGIVALMIERNPALTAAAVRIALTTAAIDLGPPGPDDQFGAGTSQCAGVVASHRGALNPCGACSRRRAQSAATSACTENMPAPSVQVAWLPARAARQHGKALQAVFVAALGMDALAGAECEAAAEHANGLRPLADQMHLDAVALAVIDRAVREGRRDRNCRRARD